MFEFIYYKIKGLIFQSPRMIDDLLYCGQRDTFFEPNKRFIVSLLDVSKWWTCGESNSGLAQPFMQLVHMLSLLKSMISRKQQAAYAIEFWKDD